MLSPPQSLLLERDANRGEAPGDEAVSGNRYSPGETVRKKTPSYNRDQRVCDYHWPCGRRDLAGRYCSHFDPHSDKLLVKITVLLKGKNSTDIRTGQTDGQMDRLLWLYGLLYSSMDGWVCEWINSKGEKGQRTPVLAFYFAHSPLSRRSSWPAYIPPSRIRG